MLLYTVSFTLLITEKIPAMRGEETFSILIEKNLCNLTKILYELILIIRLPVNTKNLLYTS